jgi:hypothetical protein
MFELFVVAVLTATFLAGVRDGLCEPALARRRK